MAQDIEELLPHLEKRGHEAKGDAEKKLAERGRNESESLRKSSTTKNAASRANSAAPRIRSFFSLSTTPKKRQLDSNRRYWQRWLENVETDLRREPERILDFYKITSFRIEPVGIAYLWPVTG